VTRSKTLLFASAVGFSLMCAPAHARRPHHATADRAATVPPAADRIDRAVNQLLVRSDVYWHAGDYDSVRACYAIITDLDPKYVEGWQNYGWIMWSALANDDAAMRVFLRGLRYNPGPYDLYFEIGNLEYHRRHFLSAAQWMAKATARKAPFGVWHMRAHCLEYAGQVEKAKALWAVIIRRFPNDPLAKTNLKRLKEGRIHLNPVIGVEALKSPKPVPSSRAPGGESVPADPNAI
jgi:tetratricopeptide (TPR) repeat protein